MNFIDKMVLYVLVLSAKYFFSHIDVEADDDGNVVSIEMWK